MNIKVTGGQTLSGEITPSGSKQLIVTLLPTSLLFDKPVTFTNVPEITDVERLVSILTQLGSQIAWDKATQTMTIDNAQVKYNFLEFHKAGSFKDMRGTVLLWGPMLARFKKAESSEQPAGCTLGARPIDAHYQGFMDLGVKITGQENHVTLDATAAEAGPVWLLEASPTATENILPFAVTLPGTTIITHAATEPNVQELCHFLVACGAKITGIGSSVLTIEGGQPLTPVKWDILSDLYEVNTFLALGAVTGGQVKVHKALPQYSVALNREFAKFGITITYEGDTAIVAAGQKPTITKTKSPMIVRAQPWPALPVDTLPLFIPLALKSESGQALFHNWMYEAGLFWTSELIKLGANVTMCDPHRVLITGGNQLIGASLEAPYIIRAAAAMLMTALIATGETTIMNADSLRRAHPNFIANLTSLGAKIEEF